MRLLQYRREQLQDTLWTKRPSRQTKTDSNRDKKQQNCSRGYSPIASNAASRTIYNKTQILDATSVRAFLPIGQIVFLEDFHVDLV